MKLGISPGSTGLNHCSASVVQCKLQIIYTVFSSVWGGRGEALQQNLNCGTDVLDDLGIDVPNQQLSSQSVLIVLRRRTSVVDA